MDHRTAVEIIVEIEERFDTNSLLYKGVIIWPIIRIDLWQQLLRSGKDFRKTDVPHRRTTKFANIVSNAIKNIKRIQSLKLKRLFLTEVKQVNIIFISRPDDNTDFANNTYFNRHIDPLVQLIRGRYNFQKIEIADNRSQLTMPRFENTVFIDPVFYLIRRRLKALTSCRQNFIEGYSELKKVVAKIDEKLILREELIIQKIKIIEEYSLFFEHVLKLSKPKVVFLVCYHSLINMAIISACKRHNVKTVDVQHGKQGKYHGMWNHWSRVPDGGYDFLPDYFWVWGEESKSNIEKWMPHGSAHKPVVGGNRWLSMWLKDDLSERTNNEKAFLEKVISYERVILVSLQPLSEPISNILIEAITGSPESWIWLIRLHPLMKFKKEDIIVRLLKLSRNVDVDMSTELPLYSLLKNSDFHVTAWSSVCYEALVFKVHSVIIDKRGKELYDEYIREGLFSYAESGKDLVEIINKDKSKFKHEETSQYIETNDPIACQALDTIMRDA